MIQQQMLMMVPVLIQHVLQVRHILRTLALDLFQQVFVLELGQLALQVEMVGDLQVILDTLQVLMVEQQEVMLGLISQVLM